MTKNMYNFARQECATKPCYDCVCCNEEFCFAADIEEFIEDFPRRDFDKLKPNEKKQVAKLNKFYLGESMLKMLANEKWKKL